MTSASSKPWHVGPVPNTPLDGIEHVFEQHDARTDGDPWNLHEYDAAKGQPEISSNGATQTESVFLLLPLLVLFTKLQNKLRFFPNALQQAIKSQLSKKSYDLGEYSEWPPTQPEPELLRFGGSF